MKSLLTKISKILVDLLEVVIISSVIVLLTFVFIGQPLVITGDSMLPILENGEHIIADKLSIKFEEALRGEVVIVTHPENPQVFLVKRIVGIPGDRFEILDGEVLIDGLVLQEPYIKKGVITNNGNKIRDGDILNLNQGQYVVLGDNRENSADSRNWGIITKDTIVGRASFVYYPMNSIRLVR